MKTPATFIKASALFALGAACMTLPAMAQDDTADTATTEQADVVEEIASDVPRRLKKVTVRGVRGAPAPTTGRVILGAGVFNGIAGRLNLSFARVNFDTDGNASLVPPSSKKRFFRVKSSSFGGEPFALGKRSPFGGESFALDLPEGYYVLSEIRHTVYRGINDGVFGASNVDFCLAEKTFAFEVVNGQTSYLGFMALNGLNSNRARDKEYVPMAGFIQTVSAVNQYSEWPEVTGSEIPGTPVRAISMDQDSAVCRRRGARNVIGWESAGVDTRELGLVSNNIRIPVSLQTP